MAEHNPVHYVVNALGLNGFFARFGSNTFLRKFVPGNLFFKNPTRIEVKRMGVSFRLNIHDYMQWHIWTGVPEIHYKLAARLSEPGDLIIDCGANVGGFSLPLAVLLKEKLNAEFTIASLEPVPETRKHLDGHVTLNGFEKKILVFPLGLGAREETKKMLYSETHSGAAHFSEKGNVPITVVPGDVFCKSNFPGKRIGFIKIDVEGFEPAVLEGFNETISASKPALYFESSPSWWEKNGYRTQEVLSELEQKGYIFFGVSSGRISGPHQTYSLGSGQMDVLALMPEKAKGLRI
jgi:FkbM family methyltransferase